MCGVCNYDCSYCIQSKIYRVGHPSDDEVARFLDFFASFDTPWEIKMTGGEPFAFKGFLNAILPGLVQRTSHTLSILTNLSAPLPFLERFATLTRGRLHVVSASLHLEHTDVATFAEKAKRLREWMSPETRLVINSVLVPERLEAFEAAKEMLAKDGLTIFPQIMKHEGSTFPYEATDVIRIERLIGKSPTPRTANTAPSYRGRLCWAGTDYFVLMQNGDAWSCRTAKRHKEGFLGNVLRGEFARGSGPLACGYDICPCTVPANRGMIEGIA